MEDAKPLSLAQRLMRAGIAKSHAYQLASTEKPPSVSVAVRIFAKTGIKIGPIANATDDEVATLVRFELAKAAA